MTEAPDPVEVVRRGYDALSLRYSIGRRTSSISVADVECPSPVISPPRASRSRESTSRRSSGPPARARRPVHPRRRLVPEADSGHEFFLARRPM
jgi:hypothetical protein